MLARKQQTRGHAAHKPTVDELLATRQRMNRASTDFLKIDLETAFTFVKIAKQAGDRVRRERNRAAARKAYETVLRFLNKVETGDEDLRLITGALGQLRSELEILGESF